MKGGEEDGDAKPARCCERKKESQLGEGKNEHRAKVCWNNKKKALSSLSSHKEERSPFFPLGAEDHETSSSSSFVQRLGFLSLSFPLPLREVRKKGSWVVGGGGREKGMLGVVVVVWWTRRSVKWSARRTSIVKEGERIRGGRDDEDMGGGRRPVWGTEGQGCTSSTVE